MLTESDLANMIAEMRAAKPFHFQGVRDGPLTEGEIVHFEEQHGVRFHDAEGQSKSVQKIQEVFQP